MNVFVNEEPRALPEGATLDDLVRNMETPAVFATAVNLAFVPRHTYAQRVLHEGDRIEIIAPITGG